MNSTPRLLAVLLAASLAGNATLLFRASSGTNAPVAPVAPPVSLPASDPAPAGSSVPAASSPETVAAVSRALSASSLTEFRDLLVAAGVEPKLRRELLQTLLQNRYADRFHELYTDKAELAQTPWWRNPDYRGFNDPSIQRERQEDGIELQKEFETELGRLTGQDSRALDFDENPWLERQYAGLPREKAEVLHRLQQDYDELEQQIRSEGAYFELPSDREKLRLLRAERERDIAELLSPEERAAWELRSSPTAERTRELATRFQASEEEYRRIYALQKAFDERFNFDDAAHGASRIDWEKHNAAQKELQNAVRDIVGPDRYLAARREEDQDYNLARSAVARLGLPPETAGTVYALREPVAQAAQRIASDASLNPEQKRDALAKLAANTRAQVERALGREAAGLYFERGGMRWLDGVGRGMSIRIGDDGVELSPLAGNESEPETVPVVQIE